MEIWTTTPEQEAAAETWRTSFGPLIDNYRPETEPEPPVRMHDACGWATCGDCKNYEHKLEQHHAALAEAEKSFQSAIEHMKFWRTIGGELYTAVHLTLDTDLWDEEFDIFFTSADPAAIARIHAEHPKATFTALKGPENAGPRAIAEETAAMRARKLGEFIEIVAPLAPWHGGPIPTETQADQDILKQITADTEFERGADAHYNQLKQRAEGQRRFNSEAYDGLGGVISWEELNDLAATPWLIPGLVPAGETVLLISKRNIGKSMFAFTMGFSVAMGMDFLGRPAKPGRVMLVLGEGTRDFIKRLNAWCNVNHVDPEVLRDRLLVYKGGNMSNDTSINDMKAVAAKFDPSLVIVDTYSSLSGVKDEVAPAENRDAVQRIGSIAPDATKLILHHPNAETENTTKPSSRGGSTIPSNVETVITMWYDTRHAVAGMPSEKWIGISTEDEHAGKQKGDERETIHGIRIMSGGGGAVLDYHTGDALNTSDQWVTANLTVGEVVTVPQLVDRLGQSKNTIRQHLQKSRFVTSSEALSGSATEYVRAY
ncbi:AAA family ATPase [Cryobacterium sinapicolor]|uniref:AAA family ATPase n=1 Tax=Cryobacterium sinapicolor TaxID=1259236 RepID=A0ABY2ITL1_9MICO|nr:AAA family ATPase [Cryobacterium sinapicolor]TFC94565.1 AAA family ATPase [Cryobacterium sinapicolor]